MDVFMIVRTSFAFAITGYRNVA